MDVQFAELAAEGEMLLPGVMCWSRKKITRFSASARWISSIWRLERESSETSLPISTPEISAPMIGVSFSTPMVS